MDHDNKLLNLIWEKINGFMDTQNESIKGYYNKLISCPFCNGFWFGLFVYPIYQKSFNIIDSLFLGISVGLFSYFLSDVFSFFYLNNESLRQQLEDRENHVNNDSNKLAIVSIEEKNGSKTIDNNSSIKSLEEIEIN